MNKNASISLEISQIFPVADHNELDKEKKHIINDSVFISKLITHSSSAVISTSHLKLFFIFLVEFPVLNQSYLIVV